MESLSRLTLYNNMLERERAEEEVRNALKINIIILKDIEPLFLSQDDKHPELRNTKDPMIMEQFRNNLSEAWNTGTYDPGTAALLRKLEKLRDSYEKKEETSSMNSRYLFNKILNELGDFNTRLFQAGKMPLGCEKKENLPQVFLSHAYDDRLLTRSLFSDFYNQGVYLYIDWMHHGKYYSGIELKRDLQQELDNSEQLLFLRTVNSELNIHGKQMIRSWCAWELGNFYRKNNDQKFLINHYSVEEYKKDINVQIHGLKLFEGINHGRLEGTDILP